MRTHLSGTRAIPLVLMTLGGLLACDDATRPVPVPEGGGRSASALAAAAQSYTLIGAADIAGCNSSGDETTAAIILNVLAADPTATVFTGGDNAYETGSAADYANCYDPSWGQFKASTHAALGNHEYGTGTADPSFDYFGSRVGARGEGWHSIDIGDWHVVFLNSNRDFVDVTATGPQVTWLKADLAASTKKCTIGIWQDPLFYGNQTGGVPGKKSFTKVFWDALYAAGAEIVINGNKHDYERFMPQDPSGNPDPKGIREFIVGTGGRSTGSTPIYLWPTSEVQQGNTFGVLKLTLGAGTYSWEFLAEPGSTFTDTGSGTCSGFVSGGTVSPAQSTATVPNGTAGSATVITVQARDQNGVALTTGGATVVVTVSGANSATPAVTDNGDGTYRAQYTPTRSGTDQVAITMNGTAIGGSPYASTVAAGAAAAMAIQAGNNQSAPAGTAVPIAPSVRVTDAFGNRVPGVTVTFAVQTGRGSVTGAIQVTNSNGVATVGSWTLGAGKNKLRATAQAGGTTLSVTFNAKGT